MREANGIDWTFVYRTSPRELSDCSYVRWTPRQGVIEMGIAGSCETAAEQLLVVWRLESGVGIFAQR